MKKIYNQPELELVVIEEETIATTSTPVQADPHGLFGGSADSWDW